MIFVQLYYCPSEMRSRHREFSICLDLGLRQSDPVNKDAVRKMTKNTRSQTHIWKWFWRDNITISQYSKYFKYHKDFSFLCTDVEGCFEGRERLIAGDVWGSCWFPPDLLMLKKPSRMQKFSEDKRDRTVFKRHLDSLIGVTNPKNRMRSMWVMPTGSGDSSLSKWLIWPWHE
jgi:hypothetical protein